MHWPVAFIPGENLFPVKEGSNPPEADLNLDVTVTQTWKGEFSFTSPSVLGTMCYSNLSLSLALIDLPKSKVRSVGVSNFTPEQVKLHNTYTIPFPILISNMIVQTARGHHQGDRRCSRR